MAVLRLVPTKISQFDSEPRLLFQKARESKNPLPAKNLSVKIVMLLFN